MMFGMLACATSGFRPRPFAVFCGGAAPTATANCTKVDYVSWAASTFSTLSAAKYASGAFGNDTEGILLGGFAVTPVTAVIERLSYATGAMVTNGNSLIVARAFCYGMSNAAKGVVIGGYASGYLASCETYVFATQVAATSAVVLSPATMAWHTFGNKTVGIYSAGTEGAYNSFVNKYTYASDTAAALASSITVSRGFAASAGNSTEGFIAGGYTPSYPSSFELFNHSSETFVTTSSTLSQQRESSCAASSPTVAAISAGSYGPGNYGTMTDRYTYATGTLEGKSSFGAAYRRAPLSSFPGYN